MTLLLVFEALLRRRKLTAVAQELGLTQSAVSHALGRLRRIFDDELFLRRPHGVEPTARASALAPDVQAILRLTQSALNGPAAFDPATSARGIAIAALDYETALLAPRLAQRLAVEAPRMLLTFRGLARATALAALEGGEVDLAIAYLPRLAAGFVATALYEETFAVAARPDHPAARAGMTLDAFCAAPHVLTSIGGDARGAVDDSLEAVGRGRRVALVVPTFFPALAAAATGSLIVTGPRRFIEAYAASLGLLVFDPPVPVRGFTVSAVTHRRSAGDPALEWVTAMLRDLAAGT